MAVERIHAREILDSRGNPTVEVDLYTHKGTPVRMSDGGKACPPRHGSLARSAESTEGLLQQSPGR